jgi:hypothetical protein
MTKRAATAILVAAALAGCGSDGDGGAAKSSAASPPSYTAKADAICAKANKGEAAAGAPGPGWIYLKEFDDAGFIRKFNAPGHAALNALRRLEPPAAQRARAATMVAAIEQMVRALDGRVSDLQAGTGHASDRIRAYLNGYSDLTPAAAVLGLSECQGVSL